MDHKEIEILIGKYFTNQIATDELKELNIWLKEENNKMIFQEYVALNYQIEQIKEVDLVDRGKMWRSIQEQIKKPKISIVRWRYAAAIAASILLLLSINFLFKKDNENIQDKLVESNPKFNNNIKIGTDKAILTLENGSNIILERGLNYNSNNIRSNGEQLIYNNQKKPFSETVYNYLTVPRGGQFYLKLSDGTQIYLNSESKLKYPVDFVEGQIREVELVYGEAYFNVSPSTHHHGTLFKVKSKLQEISVLGTVFNVKAYLDENAVYTTLVEGKVEIIYGNNSTILRPGEKARVSDIYKEISVINVDIYNEISWKDGLFSFKNKSLKEIMTVLSRWYDVNIEFSNPELEDIEFKGVLSKNQNIEEILLIIKNLNFINNYEINEKTIMIK